MTYKTEQNFIESLLTKGDVVKTTPEMIRESEEKFKQQLAESAIIPAGAGIIQMDHAISETPILEAPPMDIPIDGPEVEQRPLEADPQMDEPQMDEPPMDEPAGEDDPDLGDPNVSESPKSNVTQAIEALFMANIVKPGEHFQEFKNERMRESLRDQGLDDDMYNQIGRAFYTLDTQTDLIPNRRRG